MEKNYHQNWQQSNADKVRAYTAKYSAKKVKVSVTLKPEIALKIDKVKPQSQSYGGWIREFIENYINSLE
ncbi:MAG: hypothetical protein ACFCUV_06590 [Rivularia sp. (in: cyanobacteria)]